MKQNRAKVVALKAISEVRKVQWQMKRDQDNILEKNKLFFESESLSELVGDKLKERINKDIEAITSFDQTVAQYKESLSYGVRFNKMEDILKLVLEYSKNDENFIMDLAQGKMPKGLDNIIEKGKLPVLGSGEFWGSSKSTILSAASTLVNMELNSKSLNETLDLQKSSIAHAFPLPEKFQDESSNNYLYVSEDNRKYFSFFHSGYSLGGSRGEEKQLAPQDCGTFIEKVCSIKQLAPGATTSTADLLCTYRHGGNGFIPQKWYESPSAKLVELFAAKKDEQNIVGSVYLNRTFDEEKPEINTLGKVGHTAVILGLNEKKELVTIGASRGMPEIDGYGLQPWSRNCTEQNANRYKNVYILEPNELIIGSLINDFSDIPYNELSDLGGVVEYYDEKIYNN